MNAGNDIATETQSPQRINEKREKAKISETSVTLWLNNYAKEGKR
jgi:hypothetical protein